jgi:high-affinity Fe2+/Pb2+ permease
MAETPTLYLVSHLSSGMIKLPECVGASAPKTLFVWIKKLSGQDCGWDVGSKRESALRGMLGIAFWNTAFAHHKFVESP